MHVYACVLRMEPNRLRLTIVFLSPIIYACVCVCVKNGAKPATTYYCIFKPDNLVNNFTQSHFQNLLVVSFKSYDSGGRLNKKDGLTRYGDSHVKDKTS